MEEKVVRRGSIGQMLNWARERRCPLCGARHNREGICYRCKGIIAENEKIKIKGMKEDIDRYMPSWMKKMQIPAYCEPACMDNLNLLSADEVEDIRNSLPYKNIFLQGIPGSGKTWVSVAMMREWVKIEAYRNLEEKEMVVEPSGLFLNVPEFLASLRKMKAERHNPWKTVDEVKSKRILVLDDLGVEVGNKDFTMDILYAIINHRYTKVNRGYRMIITSDRDIEEISSEMHDRLASRLYEICTVINFPERNLRAEKKKRWRADIDG